MNTSTRGFAGDACREEQNIVGSIVVCTRNRCTKLGACLKALADLREPARGRLEVVIVDNASNDATSAVVGGFTAQAPGRFRYVHEGRKGKSHALNNGIAHSLGQIVLMTDDDCIVDADWACRVIEQFESDPELSVIGGRVLLHDPVDKPVTLRTSSQPAELRDTGPLFSFVAGCNLAVRRSVLDRLGGFDTLLGPGSPRDIGAEDIDFVYRAHRAGLRISYIPAACVAHDHGRRTDAQVAALHRSYIEGRGAFYAKHIARGDAHALRMGYWEVGGCVRDALRRPLRAARVAAQVRVVRQLLSGAAWRLGAESRSVWRGLATRLRPEPRSGA